VVTYEEGLFGGKECVENCHCLEDAWTQQHAELCQAVGDCGPGVNWLGASGRRPGYEKFIEGFWEHVNWEFANEQLGKW